ncbi:topoisomerase C-terminal repeat-containing protein [Flavobacterium sp. D11R37]|uniref:type IA DNA topoisomerase n=1 Tax=Flavobacterium coralii TaxID=2838017 RepID=UPI001CA74D73|nr:type IA DNA topoisomerase [Flavobacterium coralii]MBY8963149.1 topoisomerase C-terminal repeat-containing protein [Flavobacterium coralii]
MIVVIAEKPSVAREIALVLGAMEKKDGYSQGNGYQITWALGHLVALGMPEDYGIKGFLAESLPILPNPFLLTGRKIRKDKSYVADPGAAKQLKVIDHLFKACESIIVATDAGREGELIFRYIYDYLKCQKPFKRLWISSLTEKAIRQGFANLKGGSEFDGLYSAAQGRSKGDWLVGINSSQALSITAGSGVYSLGRVQTPTLAIICKRFLENSTFKAETYCQVQLGHQKNGTDFKSLSLINWDGKKAAEDVLRMVQRIGIATVLSADNKTISEQPPLLFDLTGLQKEANKQLGLSAEETLNIAQGLYEKKFITYPRTGSKYIQEDMWSEVPKLIKALETRPSIGSVIGKLKLGRLNKRIVNDIKVTDHHGLLVTEKIPISLSAMENLIYDMIAHRLLEAVSEACTKKVTEVILEVSGTTFVSKGIEVLMPGWRAVKGRYDDEESASLQVLPEIAVGDEIKIKSTEVLEKKTSPPALYTDASLLAAMEHAGRAIENEHERKAIQLIGIGTPATRAAIIETLLSRSYIQRTKKSLIPTEKGLKVYDLVKDKSISDVAMTAQWELALEKVENGQLSLDVFQREMEQYATTITGELLSSTIHKEKHPDLTCPKCKKHKLQFRDKLVKCPSADCNWVQYLKVCGVHLNYAEIEQLVQAGRTHLIKGMVSKSQKKFNAFIVLGENATTYFEFEKPAGRKA